MNSLDLTGDESRVLCMEGHSEKLAVVTTTAGRLGLLHLHLKNHLRSLAAVGTSPAVVKIYREIQEDVQKAVTQVLGGLSIRPTDEDPPQLPLESFDEWRERTSEEEEPDLGDVGTSFEVQEVDTKGVEEDPPPSTATRVNKWGDRVSR